MEPNLNKITIVEHYRQHKLSGQLTCLWEQDLRGLLCKRGDSGERGTLYSEMVKTPGDCPRPTYAHSWSMCPVPPRLCFLGRVSHRCSPYLVHTFHCLTSHWCLYWENLPESPVELTWLVFEMKPRHWLPFWPMLRFCLIFLCFLEIL